MYERKQRQCTKAKIRSVEESHQFILDQFSSMHSADFFHNGLEYYRLIYQLGYCRVSSPGKNKSCYKWKGYITVAKLGEDW